MMLTGVLAWQRNYRFFLLFIMTTTVLDLYVHGWCWARLAWISTHQHVDFGDAIQKEPAALALIIYTFLAFM
jgi:palmitoyltransferase ZDHHC9/14/18